MRGFLTKVRCYSASLVLRTMLDVVLEHSICTAVSSGGDVRYMYVACATFEEQHAALEAACLKPIFFQVQQVCSQLSPRHDTAESFLKFVRLSCFEWSSSAKLDAISRCSTFG